MPAKSKPKKSVKRAARKYIRKGVIRASYSPVSPEVSPPVAQPLETSVSQPKVIVAAPAKQDLAPPDAQAVPVAEPVTNLEEILDTDTKDSAADAKNRVVFTIGIIATLAIIAGAVVVFMMYLGSSKTPREVEHPAMVSPTPTPSPAFTRSQLSFEVINSSGVPGAATKGATALTQAGYTVVSVGNGKKQATSSVLLAKSLTPAEVSEVLADVNSLFSVSSSSGELTGSTASARIILGSK